MARKVGRGYEKVRKRMGKKKKRGGKWKRERRQEREEITNQPFSKKKKKKKQPYGPTKKWNKGKKEHRGDEAPPNQ